MTDILDRVETLLMSQESFIVSVKWVCERLREEMPETSVGMEWLVEALGEDGRFRLFGEPAFGLPESLIPFYPRGGVGVFGGLPGTAGDVEMSDSDAGRVVCDPDEEGGSDV